MSNWPVYEIASDVRIEVQRVMPPLAASLEAEIDRLWQTALERTRGGLFNGRVFSADAVTPHCIGGHWTEYRRIVAQMERPDLFDALGVRPLAVGGVIVGPDGVVFGRRPQHAVYQAGLWQLAPAGSIDPRAAGPDGSVDWLAQLLQEMGEELGLPSGAVTDPRALCVVEHTEAGRGSHVLDLGVALTTALDASALRAAHATAPDGEYDPLRIVALAELADFLADHRDCLARQALPFLVRAGLLKE